VAVQLLLLLLAAVTLLLVHQPVYVLLVLLAPACTALALGSLCSLRSQLCRAYQPLLQLVPAVLLLLALLQQTRARAPASWAAAKQDSLSLAGCN
jgi:hypothetical protein